MKAPAAASTRQEIPSGGCRFGGSCRLAHMGSSLLTADQVARMLGVPKTWVYEQSRKGRIPTVTLGRYRRYRAEAIAPLDRFPRGDGAEGSPT